MADGKFQGVKIALEAGEWRVWQLEYTYTTPIGCLMVTLRTFGKEDGMCSVRAQRDTTDFDLENAPPYVRTASSAAQEINEGESRRGLHTKPLGNESESETMYY